jgi:hypothetical protein
MDIKVKEKLINIENICEWGSVTERQISYGPWTVYGKTILSGDFCEEPRG